jgi:CheY-like chemotaxis protein
MVDHDRLRQVLNNIAGNAVKFTNQGSVVIRVWLEEHLREDDACVLGFSVSDTGIGIAPDDHRKVFEHFSQADGSLTRVAGGTGLGLSISRHLVELMGGTLALESELGKGSCFSFRIRVAVVVGEGSRPTGKLPRTLIVDDNQTNRTVFEELFESWGVPNDSARSGAEALEMLAAASQEGKPFELALLDQLMDGMNGTELAYEIRKRSGTRAPRLVLVTSMSESEQLDSVFDDGLSKPVLQDDLRRVIQGSDSSSRIEIEETEVERPATDRNGPRRDQVLPFHNGSRGRCRVDHLSDRLHGRRWV